MKPTSKSVIWTVQLCRETLTHLEAKDICSSLKSHNLRVLSLRECQIQDEDFHQLMRAVSRCKSLLQLNLNVGVVTTYERVEMLAKALNKNRCLTALFLHGSTLGDENLAVLMKALATHPSLISLDLGDCQLGDNGLEMICDLLPPDGAKPGLKELSLSGNPAITSRGWAKLFIALAASSSISALYLDYNSLGNYGAGCLAVALAACKTVEIVDLECTGITEHGAQILLHLIQNFPSQLNNANLTGNKIKPRTLDKITRCLVGATGYNGDSPESTGRMSESDQGEPPATQEQEELKSDAISLLVDALNKEDGSHKTVPMAQKQEQEGKNGHISGSEDPRDENREGDKVEAERANIECSAQELDDGNESDMSSAAATDDETESDTDATMIIHDDDEIQATHTGTLETTASELYAELEKITSESNSHAGDEADEEEDDYDDDGGELLTEVPVPQQYDIVRTQVFVNRGAHGTYCMMHN